MNGLLNDPEVYRCDGCGEHYVPNLANRMSDPGVWSIADGQWAHYCTNGDQCTPAPSTHVRNVPIPFSDDMVIANLEGRKTVTRRSIVKSDRYRLLQPGNVLWTRETWQLVGAVHGPLFESQGRVHRDQIQWAPCGGPDEQLGADVVELSGPIPKERPKYRHRVIYRASHMNGYSFRPPMHQPKWMSRGRLLVVKTWTEDLWDIDDAGAAAEGLVDRATFEAKWKELHSGNGPGRWELNPRVRAMQYTRLYP